MRNSIATYPETLLWIFFTFLCPSKSSQNVFYSLKTLQTSLINESFFSEHFKLPNQQKSSSTKPLPRENSPKLLLHFPETLKNWIIFLAYIQLTTLWLFHFYENFMQKGTREKKNRKFSVFRMEMSIMFILQYVWKSNFELFYLNKLLWSVFGK